MILGICGAAGSGKDTIGQWLVRRQGATIHKFADPLYAAISAITGLSVPELQDRRRKEEPLSWLPAASPRRLLQTIGTEWGRDTIHPDIWILATFRRIDASEAAWSVITDVRFDNEAEAIRARGGYVWSVARPRPAALSRVEATHSSEAGVSPHLIDDQIANTGSIDDLEDAVQQAWSRLQADIIR